MSHDIWTGSSVLRKHPRLPDFHEGSNSSPAPIWLWFCTLGTLASHTNHFHSLQTLCSVRKGASPRQSTHLTSRQQQPGHWKFLQDGSCHIFCFKMVFQDFSSMALNGLPFTSTWLQIGAGNDVRPQAEILFQNVYGGGLSPNSAKPISKYLGWCACPIHPDNPVSICIALFGLTPSLLFVVSVCGHAGRQSFCFCFMRLNGIVPAVVREASHSWRACSHTMDYHMIPPEQTLNGNIP